MVLLRPQCHGPVWCMVHSLMFPQKLSGTTHTMLEIVGGATLVYLLQCVNSLTQGVEPKVITLRHTFTVSASVELGASSELLLSPGPLPIRKLTSRSLSQLLPPSACKLNVFGS